MFYASWYEAYIKVGIVDEVGRLFIKDTLKRDYAEKEKMLFKKQYYFEFFTFDNSFVNT